MRQNIREIKKRLAFELSNHGKGEDMDLSAISNFLSDVFSYVSSYKLALRRVGKYEAHAAIRWFVYDLYICSLRSSAFPL